MMSLQPWERISVLVFLEDFANEPLRREPERCFWVSNTRSKLVHGFQRLLIKPPSVHASAPPSWSSVWLDTQSVCAPDADEAGVGTHSVAMKPHTGEVSCAVSLIWIDSRLILVEQSRGWLLLETPLPFCRDNHFLKNNLKTTANVSDDRRETQTLVMTHQIQTQR